jgi:hypothetical protein
MLDRAARAIALGRLAGPPRELACAVRPVLPGELARPVSPTRRGGLELAEFARGASSAEKGTVALACGVLAARDEGGGQSRGYWSELRSRQ